MVMQDKFEGTELNTDNWTRDVQVGGFGSVERELSISLHALV